uniref:Twitchin n=1 Tax=Plectus sambesii TaxID=2011161 RepID=A0A914UY65_9BILA
MADATDEMNKSTVRVETPEKNETDDDDDDVQILPAITLHIEQYEEFHRPPTHEDFHHSHHSTSEGDVPKYLELIKMVQARRRSAIESGATPSSEFDSNGGPSMPMVRPLRTSSGFSRGSSASDSQVIATHLQKAKSTSGTPSGLGATLSLLTEPESGGRRWSQIHEFIEMRMPTGEAKDRFLREIIDYDTPESQYTSRSASPSLSPLRTIPPLARSANLKSRDDVSDIIPASGLVISPERRKELMALSGQTEEDYEEEDDEMSESISELPSFSQGGTPKVGRRANELSTDDRSEGPSRHDSIGSVGSSKMAEPSESSKRVGIVKKTTLSKSTSESHSESTKTVIKKKVVGGKEELSKTTATIKRSIKSAEESSDGKVLKKTVSSTGGEENSTETTLRSASEKLSQDSSADAKRKPGEQVGSLRGSLRAGEIEGSARPQTLLQQQQKKKADEELAKDAATSKLQGKQVGKKSVPAVGGKEELTKIQLKKVKRDEDSDAGSGTATPQSTSRRGTIDAQFIQRRESSTGSRRDSIRRGSIDMRRESVQELLDRTSTPLKASGTAAKILEVPENVTVVENETAVMQCKVEGDPAPTFKWFKGNREVMNGGRFKHLTDGEEGTISLIMQKCRSQDDGPYTLTIENSNGSDSVTIKLLVTSDSGLDFRAKLKHKEYEGAKGKDAPDPNDRRQSMLPGKVGILVKSFAFRAVLYIMRAVNSSNNHFRDSSEQLFCVLLLFDYCSCWERPLEDKTVKQTVDKIVEWKCMYSRPNAKIRWYKDKKEIFSGGLKYKIVIEKAVCTLIINNPEVDDTGKYTCEANGLPTSAQLTVEEPPMKYNFVIPLPNTQEIYRTKEAVLTCKVNNSRAPLVWHRGGVPVKENDPRFIIEKDPVGRCTLTIKEVIESDQCEWIARVTEDVLSKVQVYVEEPRQTFVVPMKSQKVNENEDACLECDVNDKEAEVEWWHDGKKIKIDGKKYEVQASGRKRKLFVYKCKDDEHGEYKCTTKDDQTLGQLIVDALNRFTLKLVDKEVFEREDANLRCETKDTKSPGTWYRKGKAITSMPGGKFETSSRMGVHTLKISKMDMTEGDTYEIETGGLRGSCVVTVLEAERKPVINWKPNKIEAQVEKPLVLKIPFTAAPSFDAGGIKDLRLKVGETIKYEVPISGAPLPDCTWMVDGKPLKATGRVKMTTERGKHIMKIENALREDSGKFTITLKNPSGQAESTATVTVIGKPAPPKGPLEVTDVCADGGLLKWAKPADDGGEPIQDYIIEAQDIDQKGKFVEVGRAGPDDTSFKVTGLKNKGNYKFRIKAVNKEGESEPLTKEEYTQIKDPWDEPGKPGRPNVTDYDADHIDLEWDPPMKDGGAPITHYIVEKKDPVTKEWVECAQAPGTTCTVKGLTQGSEYQFRVRAVNKAGPSQPSEPSDKQIAKSRFVAAWLKHDSLRPLTVKAGQSARWEIKIGGEPPPEATWLKNDSPVEQTSLLTVDHKRGEQTTLCITAAARSDGGKYTLKVKNSVGEDQETAELIVLDKPTKPRGPLEVTDVFEDNCNLAWKAPEDDGGEPVEYYEVEKLDKETGRWTPVAKVKDCKAHVDGLKKGQTYQFRVKAVNKEGASEPLQTEKATVAKNPYDEPGKPSAPVPTDWDVDRVELEWEKPHNDGGAPITGYVIEKKSKHSREWTKAAETSGANCTGTVTGLKENEEYEFRVRAVNKAGPGEPSDPSQKVIAKPRFLKPRIDREAMKSITIKVGQSCEFDVPVRGEPPPTLVWTFKDQPCDQDKNIKVHNEDYRTQFWLKSATRAHAGKYTLTATNDSGTDKADVDVIVLGRPSHPQGPLIVTQIFEDRVNLDWQPPEDDGGLNIDHYEIEKMDLATGRWVPCGRTNDTKTTVASLQGGHSYQFRVRAVNKEGESDPLTNEAAILAKNPYDAPDKMDKPELVDWDKDHVDLSWKPPANDNGAPVEKYIVEKKDKHGRWEKALEVPASQTTATVDNLMAGEEYQFRVMAVNKAGPSEASDPSDRVIAKARFLAPKINRNDLPQTTAKVGQPVKFNVNIEGEPPPEVTWEFNGAVIRGDANLTIENPDYISRFLIPKASRKQSGHYKITATNSSGTDVAEVDILIKGKPSKPLGPLAVSDVFDSERRRSANHRISNREAIEIRSMGAGDGSARRLYEGDGPGERGRGMGIQNCREKQRRSVRSERRKRCCHRQTEKPRAED